MPYDVHGRLLFKHEGEQHIDKRLGVQSWLEHLLNSFRSKARKYNMHERQNTLNKWLQTLLGTTRFNLTPLAGDASFRRYFRLQAEPFSGVVMDAPPEKENIQPFLAIGYILRAQGIHTPRIYAVEKEQGFILLEDLGDTSLLAALTTQNVDSLYRIAIDTLLKIQHCPTSGPEGALPVFDTAFMFQELALFREWFLEAYLKLVLTPEDEHVLNSLFEWLVKQLKKQPQVFIHRDYHSRNLMLLESVDHSHTIQAAAMLSNLSSESLGPVGKPRDLGLKAHCQQTLEKNHILDVGVIDYQDAMHGPFTYDLVSLLKDCYIQWPQERLHRWLKEAHERLPYAKNYSLSDFIQAFDLMGLQRHLKILGIFCRLYLRDHKPNYLRDLPLAFHYTMACLEHYAELHPFYQWMQKKVAEPFGKTCS